MAKRNKNTSLHQAKRQRYDEFYTQRSDIDRELGNYREHFRGKTVLCNCDDPRESNFFKYFASNFRFLGLKRLIATCYKSQNIELFSDYSSEQAVYIDYRGEGIEHNDWLYGEVPVKSLEGDGSFDSDECIELLKQADIVVTNPPFSLFRQYVACLVKYNKKFLIIGNTNAITYKELFPLIKNNELWLGVSSFNKGMYFQVPAGFEYSKTYKFERERDGVPVNRVSNVCWFTNLEHPKRNEELILVKKYKPEDYPKYENYDAINVDTVKDIPYDYVELIGVPIGFMDKYNPKQFEIVGRLTTTKVDEYNFGYPYVAGVKKFVRILIRFRKEYFETHQF